MRNLGWANWVVLLVGFAGLIHEPPVHWFPLHISWLMPLIEVVKVSSPGLLLAAGTGHPKQQWRVISIEQGGFKLVSHFPMSLLPRQVTVASISVQVQFSSLQSLSHIWLCDTMNCNTQGLPVHRQLLEFTQTHVYSVGDAIQQSHPLLSSSPPASHLSKH